MNHGRTWCFPRPILLARFQRSHGGSPGHPWRLDAPGTPMTTRKAVVPTTCPFKQFWHARSRGYYVRTNKFSVSNSREKARHWENYSFKRRKTNVKPTENTPKSKVVLKQQHWNPPLKLMCVFRKSALDHNWTITNNVYMELLGFFLHVHH